MEGSVFERLDRLERRDMVLRAHLSRGLWHAVDAAYAASLKTRELRCIVCDRQGGRAGFEVVTAHCCFGGGVLERYRCPNCDCIFGPQKYLDLSEEFVASDYEFLYQDYSEGDSAEAERRTFQFLDPRPCSGRAYLDWGSGGTWSQTVAGLRAEGYDVWGYEPNAKASGDFIVRRREDIEARFSGIFSNNVIEHLREPVAQFTDFHGLLLDDGIMAHSSPCYEYRYSDTRFHTLFLLGRSVHVLAERTGFRVTDELNEGVYCNRLFVKV